MSEETLRVPYSEEAEKGACGALLLDPMRLVPVAERLRVSGESFHDKACGEVFGAIMELWHASKPVDVLTVCDKLREGMKLEVMGGTQAVDAMVDACVTAAHGEYYLDTLVQKEMARAVMRTCEEIRREASVYERGYQLIKNIPQRFLDLAKVPGSAVDNAKEMQEILDQVEAASNGDKAAVGIPTPWRGLTQLINGLEPGITILAGRPSEGKSVLEGELAKHAAKLGYPVARVARDMTPKTMLARWMCNEAGVSWAKARYGFAGRSQRAELKTAKELLEKLPVYINGSDNEVRGVCTWIRGMHMRHGIKLVTIDFVQLLNASELGFRAAGDANVRLAYISRTLKSLALELKIPIVLLSQLSREIEKEGRPPKLSDLRDSGALEQDAEKVAFIYRDIPMVKSMEAAEPGATKKKRPIWVDVLKNQNGEIGKLPFWFHVEYSKFVETDGFEESGEDRNHGGHGGTESPPSQSLRRGDSSTNRKPQAPSPIDEGVMPMEMEGFRDD